MKKPSKTTLTRKLDKAVSEIIRFRGKCEFCGDKRTLQCCHIFSRSNRATRWRLLNLLCLCASCHFWSHKNPILFTERVKELLSDEAYEELKKEATTIKQWSIEELKTLYTKLKEELC